MIKRLLLLCFIHILALSTYAQSESSVITNYKPIGRNYQTQKDILAKETVFPEKIYHTYIDTLTNLITVQLRGTSRNGKYLDNTGKLIVFDLTHNKVKWSKPMNYFSGSISQHNHLLIQTIGNRSYSLNPETGEEQWEVKNTIFYADPFQKIGMGYKIRNVYLDSHFMEGIDLLNGNLLWKREIKYYYGWNGVIHLTDSTLLIASSGLHLVNVINGTGWDYDAETGYSNSGGVVRNIVSNVLVDSAHITLASMEKISRMNHQGQLQWSTLLPDKLTSKSDIFIKDSIIYLVNRGYAFMGQRRLDIGKAFIAAYHLKTGKQLFLTKTKDEKDEINDFGINKDNLMLVFKDRISKYSLQDGSLMTEKEFDPYYHGQLKYAAGSQIYIKTDSTYRSMILADTTNYYIITDKEKIVVLNNKLEEIKKLNSNELYTCYRKEKEYKFLAKGNKTTVIDRTNKAVADIDISSLTKRIGNKLYNIQEKSFIELSINDLTNNNIP